MTRRNENRQGYKKTKVGWIPEKWECIKLKDLSKLGPQNGLYKKQDAYDKDGCRMVHMPQLFANDIIEDQDMPKVLLNESEKIKYLIEEGDLLFGRRSLAIEGSGKCSLVGKLTTPITFESSIIRISLDNRKLYPKYSYFYIASPYGRYQMFTITRVVAVSGIAGSDLKLYQIPLPPLPEQKKIAEILSAWDRAIEQVGRLIDAKKQLKKGLMQQLLTGRIRFSEFNHETNEIHKKEKGELPEGWKRVKLEDIAIIKMGTSPSSSFYNNEGRGFPLIQGNADIKERKTSPSRWTAEITTECFVDDLVMTVRAPVGEIAVSEHHACVGRGACVIRPLPETDKIFLFQLLISIEQKWNRFGQGSTFTCLTGEDIRNYKFVIPKIEEQTRIAAVLSACDREIELLKKKQEKLQEQKKGLMQKLLTGEIRVK